MLSWQEQQRLIAAGQLAPEPLQAPPGFTGQQMGTVPMTLDNIPFMPPEQRAQLERGKGVQGPLKQQKRRTPVTLQPGQANYMRHGPQEFGISPELQAAFGRIFG